MQAALIMAHTDLDIGQKGFDGSGVFRVDPRLARSKADGAVDRAGINIEKAERFGAELGNGTFSGPGGAVYRNGDVIIHRQSFQVLDAARLSEKAVAAACAVDHAIWRLKPPV